MSISSSAVLAVSDDLPIRSDRAPHSGKVRSVYWLTRADSARLICERNYAVAPDAELAVMVISDRLSAFDCLWHAQGGLSGVPGKGAALNTIAAYWFDAFAGAGLADSHILEMPHPLVWIVQKASPIKIEAIARQYITGSMWRAYAKGERNFCGITLPEGLQRDQKLPELLVTPSTKGILRGIPGVPEVDDVNIARADILNHYAAFGFREQDDIAQYERLLGDGFRLISDRLADVGQVFVDTKFEFGYAPDASGRARMIYMDEVGTPDSSRMWDADALERGDVIENSKEGFRQQLLAWAPEPDVLLNSNRMAERQALAASSALPASIFEEVSKTYTAMAERITGAAPKLSEHPRNEIIQILTQQYNLV